MAFIVSARKYRPQRFVDVVGQKSVSTTLKNAIKNNKLAQSFLFCGPRGVGKTTCARILAKAINCENLSENVEPCGTCNSCTSFNQSASFNIFELDAASNNSVEDIRNLIEQVRFAPQAGKYKIYIIDEVHMLSQAAFNAFLKTLEEPPSYAIFILATTEKHKIIPTILSRCQIFDFSRITVQDMSEHLAVIAKDQNVAVEDDALHIIAQKADGGLRDALSIFDRIASFAEGKIVYQNVIDALNILDYDYFFKATDSLLAQDTSNSLLLFDKVLQKGFEGDNFVNGLCSHFRNLLVCKHPETLTLLDVTKGLKERYKTQAGLSPSSFLLSALNIANQCEINYKTSKNKRLQVELALLKMCFINQAIEMAKMPAAAAPAKAVQNNVTTNQVKAYKTNEPILIDKSKKRKSKPDYKSNVENYISKKGIFKLPTSNLQGTLLFSKKEREENAKKQKQLRKKADNQTTFLKITDEQLQKYWKKFIESLGEKGVAQNILIKIIPKAINNSIQLIVSSNFVKKQIDTSIRNFLDFLREKEGHHSFNIQWKIDKSAKTRKANTPKVFLPSDTLKQMMAKNPKLAELTETLG
ncbi:MAG: DNA polymerase III subunit gamma/tau, partial [Chitinophagales bacterium]